MVPTHLEKEVIDDFHSLGHFGSEKLSLTMRSHVLIFDLKTKVKIHVMKCMNCQARSGPHRKQKLPLKSQVKGFFNEKVQLLSWKKLHVPLVLIISWLRINEN